MHDWQMTPREHLGMSIAAMTKLTRKGPVWLVPSQSGPKRYTVSPDPTSPHCSCPDHDETGQRCKHIFAVEYVLRREDNADGTTTVTEQVTVTHRIQKTYPQNWPAYNAAQTNEKADFQKLLHDLCQQVESPPQGRGRPRIPLADAVFTATLKVYSTMSARRFSCDLRDAHTRGYIGRVPHFNSVLNAFDDEAMRPALVDLVEKSSLPFTAFETIFAADSTGFASSRHVNWYEKKHRGGARREHDWVKAHFTCGVRSNVVTAVEIGPRDAQDSPFLPSMLQTTKKNFQVDEFLADKAYGSVLNHIVIDRAGATAYIPFKSNHNGQRGGIWKRKLHEFHLHREEFLQHYHQRSNAETTVHMIKSKFRDEVRAKTEPAMINEVLCKFLAHNICCLIHAMYEIGLPVDFQTVGNA